MFAIIKPIAIVFSLLTILLLAIWGLGDALAPLILSFFLAYLMFPVVRKLERQGVNRNFSVSALFICLSLFTILFVLLVMPKLASKLQFFLMELPENSIRAVGKVEALAHQIGYPLDISKEKIQLYVAEHISEFSTSLLKNVANAVRLSFSSFLNWILAFLNLFLIPVFFFYVINDFEKIALGIRSFIPRPILPKLQRYAGLANTVLSGYIRGQLLVALALAGLYSVGLSLVGLRFGFLIGFLAGLISIIPYAGFTLGFLTAIIMALANFSGIGQIIGIVLVFTLVQALEGFIITPKLVGDKVGLSAFATIIALIIGGNIFGLTGMLIAIPTAAIIKTLVSELKSEYQQLDFYQE